MKKILSVLPIIFALLLLALMGCIAFLLFRSLILNWDLVFQSLLNNIPIFVTLITATLTYVWNEKSKLRERQQQERDKQKINAMQVYQNYLNTHFYIMRDKDFSPTNEHVLESRRILQSQLPLFVPDDILKHMASMQENARQLYFHQIKQNVDISNDLEKQTLAQMNKLIELMRKDLMPSSTISDKDIEQLLSTSFEFIQWARENEKTKTSQ